MVAVEVSSSSRLASFDRLNAQSDRASIPRAHRRPPPQPEHHLLGAILELAMNDVAGPNDELRRQAIDWFLSDESEWTFSFLAIADVFELDAQAIRQRVFRRKRTERRAIVRRVNRFGQVRLRYR